MNCLLSNTNGLEVNPSLFWSINLLVYLHSIASKCGLGIWQHLAGCPQGLSSLQAQCWLGCLLSGGPTKAGSSATLTQVVGRLPHFAAMRLRVTGFCCQLEGALSNDSFLHFLQATHSSSTCRQALTWPESSFRFFWMMLWKELFGQPQNPSGQQRNVCCLEPFNWGKVSPSFKVDSYFRQTHPG